MSRTNQPPGPWGGIGLPGTRETRTVTLKDELARIQQTTGWMIFFTAGILGLLIIDLAIIGPVVPFLVILFALPCVAYWAMTRYKIEVHSGPYNAILIVLLVAMCVWGFRGYIWIAAHWFAYRPHWDWYVVVTTLLLSFALKALFACAIRSHFLEQVDPNGPTAPRVAVPRDKAITPWSPETYGGAVLPGTPQPSAVAREAFDIMIHDMTTGERPRPQHIPCQLFSPYGTPGGLSRYADALLRDDDTRATFSYAGGKTINGAQFYGYTPTEFGELEAAAVRAGLVARKRKSQPYEITPRGGVVLGRIARRGLEAMNVWPPWRR